MPIYRFRSDNYADGNKWNAVSNIYRFNDTIAAKWQKIKKIYRYNASATTKWQLIFLSTDAPQPATPYSSLFVHSSTYGTVGSTTEFYSGDVVRLSRGAWTASPTSYQLLIQTSLDAGANYSTVSSATYNSSSSPTAASTTSSTYIPYTITSSDALYPSYYVKGRVNATNADGTTPLETPAILLRVGFGLSGFTTSSITGTGATFSWNITGTPDASSYIYSQVLTIRKVSDGTVVKTVNVTPGTSTVSVYDSINIATQTQYYAKLVVTANDSWRTSASPTIKTDDYNLFTTAGAAPVNTVSPTIGPLNNRTPPSGFAGYLPVSTSLTATQGTWSNVSGSTTYRYDWYKEDYITGALVSNLNVGSGFSYATADVDDYVFVQVRATNTDGQLGTGTSGSYILGQRVAVGTITPTSVTPNQSTNFSFAISHYPTSYTINWGDGTSNETYNVSANTSTVNATHAHTYTSAGSYTITVIAQPGGFGNTASITVANPLTPPTSVSIASVSRATDSSVNVSLNFSGGTGPYYQMYWTTASTAPATTSYDAASIGSPISETFSPSSGYQYYFYVRSSTDNLGNTTLNGNSATGTYSAYSSLSTNPSYTFTTPTGGTASISGNTSVGSTLTLSTSAPSASPAADGLTIVWRIANGGTGGNSYTGGTILQNGGYTLVIPSTAAGISTIGYAIRAEVVFNNGVGSQAANSGSIVVTSAGVAPSGGSVSLSPSGTVQARTAITANVTAMSGTATISYFTSIRKKTGSAPTSITDGTEVASGTGTGNVASHTITDSEASGTPDQFRAFTTGTNSVGSNTVSSNTVISTPYVPPVSIPSGGTAISTPSTGTAGTTTYIGSTSGWSGSPTSYSYSWQYFSSSSFSWVQYTSGTSFSPPANVNTSYPNYGWQLSVGATNSAGTAYATTSITVNNPTVVTAPGAPTIGSVSGSGSVSWTAPTTGGAVASYEIEFYTASNSTGSNVAGPYTVTGISSSPYQLTSPYGGTNANWARARVRARNSGGASPYSDWAPSATTYA
jgi:hypothetical protein